MAPLLNQIVSVYGALLSTALALVTVVRFLRERPRISVKASTISVPATPESDTHGVLLLVKETHGTFWKEVNVQVRVHNSGAQQCQIAEVFVETAREIHFVRPLGLPVILQPNTGVTVEIQPEYMVQKVANTVGTIRSERVLALGVVDAIGKMHRVRRKNLQDLASRCEDLPMRTVLTKHAGTGDTLVGFQVKDDGHIVSKVGRTSSYVSDNRHEFNSPGGSDLRSPEGQQREAKL